jgi:hypothetical protein
MEGKMPENEERKPQGSQFTVGENRPGGRHTRRDDPDTRPEREGEFGEEFGDDRGYGRRGSYIEPQGHEQVPGDEYTRQMDMSEYTDILLDEDQGRQRAQTSWERDDERIYSEAAQRLAGSGLLASSDITLMVERGEVTLTGVVNSQESREKAVAAVNAVVGVTGVNNRLSVRGEGPEPSPKARE